MIALVLAMVVGVAQPGSSAPAVAPLEARVPELGKRLASLRPTEPRAYLELGEEVLSESTDDGGRRLARELFVLSLELSRSSAQPDQTIIRSALLALASIAPGEEERRWLLAVADSAAADGFSDATRYRSTSASRDPAAFELATLFSYVRSGEGRRATKLLEKPGVSELLEKCDKLLIPGVGGGATAIRKMIDDHQVCQRCRNRRSIKEGGQIIVCPTCHGTPGPELGVMQLLAQLRTESVLLSGEARSWAAQLISDGGAPIRELDIAEVAGIYNVDPAKPLWKNGVWTADPQAPKKDQSSKPAPPAAQPSGESGAGKRTAP